MLDADVIQTKTQSFDVATAAIKGAREYQEDSLISSFPIGQSAGFAVISDGLGGHAAGDTASALVATEMFAQLKMQESQLLNGALDVPDALRAAITTANQKIASHVQVDADTTGMGATLLAPVIQGDRLSWISVGDSPLYLLRDGVLNQLNQDHSMAPQIDMMVMSGMLTAEAGATHPHRNSLISVLDGQEIAQIDCPASPMVLQDADILIAATDGLQFLSEALIAKTLTNVKDVPAAEIARALLAALAQLNHPQQDNTAFVVIKVNVADVPGAVVDFGAMPVLAHVDVLEASA